MIAEGVVAAVKEVGLRSRSSCGSGANVEIGKQVINTSGLNIIAADDQDREEGRRCDRVRQRRRTGAVSVLAYLHAARPALHSCLQLCAANCTGARGHSPQRIAGSTSSS